MGKKNNKNKKIAKQPKSKGPLQKNNSYEEGEEQFAGMQGKFQTLVQESNAENQVIMKESEKQIQQIQQMEISYLGHHFNALKNERCFKIVNLQNEDISILIVEGTIINNGKILNAKDQIRVKANSSAVVEVFKNGEDHKMCLEDVQNMMNSNAPQTEEILTKIIGYTDCALLYHKSNKGAFSIKISECYRPWSNLNICSLVSSNETTMLVGLKNTGKSTLCEYVLNKTLQKNKNPKNQQFPSDVCVLDMDVGRNRTYPGCISLTVVSNRQIIKQTSIWVGEYTVLNNIQTYLKALCYLYQTYRKHYFGSPLLINTMGYLTGLGELLIYQIYDIVKPQKVILMEGNEGSNNQMGQDSEKGQQHKQLSMIRNKMLKKQYRNRLYFGQLRKSYNNNQQQISTFQVKTTFLNYTNNLVETKGTPQRFQYLISPRHNLRSLEELLDLIFKGVFKKMHAKKHYEVYQQDKMGQIRHLQWSSDSTTDMRLVILAQINQCQFFQVIGVGFGWKGAIYYDPINTKQPSTMIGAVLTDGIDFERNFYQINQSKLILLQEKLGERVCYLMPILKVLGNRGVRNNPGKRNN